MMPFGSGKLTKSGALPAWGVCSTRKQEVGRRREGRREERKKGGKEGRMEGRREESRGREEEKRRKKLTAEKDEGHYVHHIQCATDFTYLHYCSLLATRTTFLLYTKTSEVNGAQRRP